MHHEGSHNVAGEDAVCAAKVDRLFRTFATYSNPGQSFCDFCYTPDEVARITQTALTDLDVESARTLLWETADHWESADVYRHYLPRLLQMMGPPWLLEDLYPAHLFETLLSLGYRRWPPDEQLAVVEFLECVESHLRHTESDRQEWATAMTALRQPEGLLPPAGRPDVRDA